MLFGKVNPIAFVSRPYAHFSRLQLPCLRNHFHMTDNMQSSQHPAGSDPSNNPEQEATTKASLLALPGLKDADGTVRMDMSTGSAEAKLDDLGPLVVNQNGTVSRIDNWQKMNVIEKENTLRVLGKRNKMRLEKLKAERNTE